MVAISSHSSLFLLSMVLLLCSSHATHEEDSKFSNVTGLWLPGGATWYGAANGAGSDGGACGYGVAVGRAPFSSLVAAGGPSLFKSGQGCGACYEVRCTSNKGCSGKPVKVVITDECPGGPCFYERFHFDLSGTAIGAMALPGHADQLRAVGILPILLRRVSCEYSGVNIAFHVDIGSNPNYLSVLIEFMEGDGNLAAVSLRESTGPLSPWRPMSHSWGALWRINSGPQLHAPFSLRLITGRSRRVLIARDIIPRAWKPGTTYRSLINFEA